MEQGLDLPGVMVESEKRGVAFEELLAIPEQDNWEYSDGFSTTCVAFILQMYKEAGLFGPLGKSIQVTEFTVCVDPFSFRLFPDSVSKGERSKMLFIELFRILYLGDNTIHTLMLQ